MSYKINYHVREVTVIMSGFMVIININLAFDSEINYYQRHLGPKLTARESIEI